MKKIIVALGLFVFITTSQANQQDISSQVEALTAQKEYRKAFAVLNQALRDTKMGPLERLQVLKSLAEFNEKLIGNQKDASRLYNKILKINVADDHPIKSLAKEESSRLKSLEDKFSEQDEQLKKVRISSSQRKSKEARRKDIAVLQAFIKDNPEYYRLSDAYYYLGQSHMDLEEYGRSYKSYKRCKQLKPAIDFRLPVTVRAKVARRRWLISSTKTIVWSTIGVLWILAVIVFYVSRPWRLFKLKHLIFGLAMIFLWWVVFNVSHKWLGERFEMTDTAINEIGIGRPCFANAEPNSPGSRIAGHLFIYGVVGVIGVFVFCIGASRIKYLPVRLLINGVFGLLLFACLTVIFYMRYCEGKSRFNSQAKGKQYYLKGNIYTVLHEPEPYILTNPKAYPNIDVEEISKADFREWVIKHCPFDTTDKETAEPQRR